MPWSINSESDQCPEERPIAVVNDEDGELEGCFPDEESAQRHIDMLMEQEEADDGEAAIREVPWRAPILVREGEATCDGRIFIDLGARDLPLPLSWQRESQPGHAGSVIVGRIDEIVDEGNGVRSGRGVIAPAPEDADVLRQLEERFLRGISIDAAPTRGATVEVEEDSDQFDGMLMTLRGFLIAGATLVPIPAFEDAEIVLEDAEAASAYRAALTAGAAPTPLEVHSMSPIVVSSETSAADAMDALVAAAGPAPDAPPLEWFLNPELDRRRGLHIEADGRVWGHVCGWDECHLGSPPGQCVRVPRGCTSRGLFAGQDGRGVLTAEGELVSTGPLVVASDHADLNLSWLAAKDHYSNTALAVADVACGEDDHGIWVAGAIRPGTPPELVRIARASAPSIDCRPVGGRLELIALLAVNMPGYPAMVASMGDQGIQALVASGAPLEDGDCGCGGSSSGDLAAVRAELAALNEALAPWLAQQADARAAELAARDRWLAEQRERLAAERAARVLV